MLVYVYDGSFEGILTAVYEAYYRKEKPGRLQAAQNFTMNLFDRYEHILTDREKADKVYQAVLTKISASALRRAFHVFLSDDPDKGTRIYRYLQLGFRCGAMVDRHLHEEDVLAVHQISRRVAFECHRFTGLLRFAKMEREIYYAKYEPDHNITMLLAPHFAARLSDQDWIIHDAKRGLAAIYNRQEWILTDDLPETLPEFADDEMTVQGIWQGYFRSIFIAERKNIRLQKNMMPARYWKNLTEMDRQSQEKRANDLERLRTSIFAE